MSFLKMANGEEIFYRDQGRGTPVILIHGWPLNADMWEYQVPALLESGYRVITYDRRGFGRSTQPASGYDYDHMAEDLKELINRLELQSCALVGFSMGGGEIARYLGKYGSAKISRVALVSSVTPFMMKASDNPEGLEPQVFEKIREGLKEDRPHFLAGFARDFFGVGLITSPVSEELLRWTNNLAMTASPVATLECVRAFSATDFRADLKAFDMPTLIIHGTADKIVPIEVSALKTARLIPTAKLIRYDGAPHGLFITHKRGLTQDLISFLGDVSLMERQSGVPGYDDIRVTR